jgi:hypothetical protein
LDNRHIGTEPRFSPAVSGPRISLGIRACAEFPFPSPSSLTVPFGFAPAGWADFQESHEQTKNRPRNPGCVFPQTCAHVNGAARMAPELFEAFGRRPRGLVTSDQNPFRFSSLIPVSAAKRKCPALQHNQQYNGCRSVAAPLIPDVRFQVGEAREPFRRECAASRRHLRVTPVFDYCYRPHPCQAVVVTDVQRERQGSSAPGNRLKFRMVGRPFGKERRL